MAINNPFFPGILKKSIRVSLVSLTKLVHLIKKCTNFNDKKLGAPNKLYRNGTISEGRSAFFGTFSHKMAWRQNLQNCHFFEIFRLFRKLIFLILFLRGQNLRSNFQYKMWEMSNKQLSRAH